MSDVVPMRRGVWRDRKLSELATIVGGGTPSRTVPAFWNGAIPWATPTDITACKTTILRSTKECISRTGLRSSAAKLVPPGTVLMTSRATVGECRLASTHVATNQGFKNLVPKEGVDGRLLMYQMTNHRHRYENYGIGTTFLEVSKKDTERFVVPFPDSLDEQCRIADLLSAVDENIHQAEAQVEKERLRFAGLQQLLLSCSRLRDSEIDNVLLRQLVPVVQYGISTSLETQGVIPVLRMNNLFAGEVDVSDVKYSPLMVSSDLVLRDGDVLFNRTNSMEHVGRTSIWRSQLPTATFASYLVRLHPDENRITKAYLVYLLSWAENQTQMRRYATPGVQQVNINPTSLRRCRVCVPRSLDTQRETVLMLDASREQIASLVAEVEKLRLQKQGLAIDLLAGEVRVPS